MALFASVLYCILSQTTLNIFLYILNFEFEQVIAFQIFLFTCPMFELNFEWNFASMQKNCNGQHIDDKQYEYLINDLDFCFNRK